MMAMQASLMPGENRSYNDILDETKKKARSTLRASSSAEAEVVGGSSTQVVGSTANNNVPAEPSNINAASNIISVAPSSPAMNFAPGAASISASTKSSTIMNFYNCNFPTASFR